MRKFKIVVETDNPWTAAEFATLMVKSKDVATHSSVQIIESPDTDAMLLARTRIISTLRHRAGQLH
jgi:hypothetical protein